jgi:glyoxylase-like metal-dependent hydrolase (beta-lactamase superfamily II)
MLQSQMHGPVIKYLAARPILGHSFYHTAAYWVDGLLIDSGCAFTAHELRAALAALPLSQIVNTHSHEDHIGANGRLQQERGTVILAHPLALPILANPHLQYLQLYRRLFWGWPQPSQGVPVGEWIETEHHRFQGLSTPGHSPDHVCLYEPQEGWLFAGDAYIGGQDHAARPDYDMEQVITSLQKLAALQPGWLFPGSGTVRADATAELQRKVAYLEELRGQARRLHGLGCDEREIQKRLLGREPYITYLTLGHFRGSYLIQALLRPPEA